jgi:basic membrane lipoprotein Med (substrate-binding protein (PBP1-ABC) superfamily)
MLPTSNARYYEGRYLAGVAAGQDAAKTILAGYVAAVFQFLKFYKASTHLLRV